MATVNKSEKDRVIIFDTTLRDGEQCPGATMTIVEKIEVAELLDDKGVDVIEAVIKAGATTVNIPDTGGYTVPEEYTHFMKSLIVRVPNSDKAVFSVHCL